MTSRSPLTRISFGLVLLTVSMLLISEVLGLLPKQHDAALKARQQLVDSLAVQFTAVARHNDIQAIQSTFESLVARNPQVLSAGLRAPNGRLLAEAGDHGAHWPQLPVGESTPEYAQLPVFNEDRRWATLEVRFAPLSAKGLAVLWSDARVRLSLYFLLSGFVVYRLFLKRTLRYLDPAAVIPERVKAAMDAMTEGVLILDNGGSIVLANRALADAVGEPAAALLGREASSLRWQFPNQADRPTEYPWDLALLERERQTGVALALATPEGQVHTFMVNSAPILDAKDTLRGTLVTFDDVTEVERKNAELQKMLTQLERSQREVKQQNKTLHYLATRDPLTGCLNRRAFFQKFDTAFDEARRHGQDLACIMADIDRFKSINDNYGHSIGDNVIKSVALALRAAIRNEDFVGRYGGEEFCVILPGIDIERAERIADRLRQHITSRQSPEVQLPSGLTVTASLGVSTVNLGAGQPTQLVDEADKALYTAKQSGRNRVVRWDDALVRLIDESGARGTSAGESDAQLQTTAAPAAPPAHVVKRLTRFIKDLKQTVEKKDKELRYQQGHDVLTGLPNNLLFVDRIRQALNRAGRYNQLFAVMVLDIKGFKRINDSLGYAGGDQALQAVGERLAQVLRTTDSVARLSDAPREVTVARRAVDEFGLLLTDLDGIASAETAAERIFSALSKPLPIEEQEVYINCSVGISVYPYHGDAAETLLRNASIAMRQGKSRPGHSFHFYAEHMDQTRADQLQIETELRHALKKQELVLHYQPQVSIRSGQIVGMEALVRWQHPERGLVPPGEFIPIAESTGLIGEMGDWVLLRACRQAKAWIEAGIANTRVAVNVSALQFGRAEFLEQVTATLRETGLPAQQLELEITESTVVADVKRAVEALSRLREIGVRTAIDDFGTGYSSLSYIKRFPIDCVKIDRSFVHELAKGAHSLAIVTAIIKMSHDLGLTVIAEGVETQDQLEQLADLQCEQFQGFLVGRPVPRTVATKLLQVKPVYTSQLDLRSLRLIDRPATG